MKKIERPSKPRAVLDSNLWISAFLVQDRLPAMIADAVIAGEFHGIISDYIIEEVGRALSKPKLIARYGLKQIEVSGYTKRLRANLENVSPHRLNISIRDERDLPILGTALAGKADYLVTGDRDLLEDQKLIQWMLRQGVRIVSPAEFAAKINISKVPGNL